MNHLIHMGERIVHLLKSLEDQSEISEKEKYDSYSSDSKPGVPKITKVHKTLEDGTPSFRPILLAKETPTYNLSKFWDPFLKPQTRNSYAIKDTFSFSKEVLEFDPSIFITSFHIKSIFTRILLIKTFNFCGQNLYRNQTMLEA